MQVSPKTQWWMIGGGYFVVTAYAADLLYSRHQDMLRDPTIASSGMYAFGDLLTVLFLLALYLVPTLFSLRLLARNVQIYYFYSHVLLLIGITAPLALAVLILNETVKGHLFGGAASWRILCSPLVLIVMGVSRWFASSIAAKRSIKYALLVEGATLVVSMVLLVLASFGINLHFTN